MAQMAYVGGPIAAWKEAIEAEVKVTADRARAVRNVVRRNPELHKAYLEAYNAERGRTVRQ